MSPCQRNNAIEGDGNSYTQESGVQQGSMVIGIILGVTLGIIAMIVVVVGVVISKKPKIEQV